LANFNYQNFFDEVLVEDVAKQLNMEPENPSAYQNKIDSILEFAKTNY